MPIDRPRPVKVTDDEFLLEIARMSDTVHIGPTTRELEDSLDISNGTAFRRTERLREQGLVKHGYRGLILTEEGRKRAETFVEHELEEDAT